MSIIHEALKKASRKRGGLFRLIEYEPIHERLHIERTDSIKRYGAIIIIALVALNVSIFAWNFSLKSEMRRLALSAFPDGIKPEHAIMVESQPEVRKSHTRAEAPAESEEETILAEEDQQEDISSVTEEALPELTLKGTMISQTRSRAFINNRMLKEGDDIEGAEVVIIRENSVLLRKGEREFEIIK